jgi:asparagine synthase (glutamine-hydrolysing)
MCGIFVAFNHKTFISHPIDKLKSAVDIVSHRGPNNIDHFAEDHCFLGHSRLAIIGLNESSNQPFRRGNLRMTYNGEIFNYEELRTELQTLGQIFHTDSDTEVVIAAYTEWGVDCFSRFNGMWALALYDNIKRELVVSRDRFGQKPLFMSKSGTEVYFASEFQQLSTLVDKDIDYGLIQMFLKEGNYEGEGRTFQRNIQEFPKAHYLRITREGEWESRAYWNYWSGEVATSDEETVSSFSNLLSDAVRLRLRSDVPIGILVSGGVDSTLIASYCRQHVAKETAIPAFVFSSGDAHDELAYSEAVSKVLNLELDVHRTERNPRDYLERLKVLVRHLGRGHSSPAIVPVDLLYESAAKKKVLVILDGQGADELLAGYKNYFLLVIPWYVLRGQFRQAWLVFRDQLHCGFFSSVLQHLRNYLPPSFRKIMRLFYGYELLFRKYREVKTPRWITLKPVAKNSNLLNRHLIRQHALNLENLLYYGDIIAMKNSVENRSPFMDHRLVEFAFSFDDKLKLKDAIDKYALRRSVPYQQFLDILDRDKVGFSADLSPEVKRLMIVDLRKSPILEWPIFSSRMRKFVNFETLMIFKFERILFRLYQVHLWNEIFINEISSSRPQYCG